MDLQKLLTFGIYKNKSNFDSKKLPKFIKSTKKHK